MFKIRTSFNTGYAPVHFTLKLDDTEEARIAFWNIVHNTEERGHNEHIDRMELKQGNKVLAMQRFIDGRMA